MVRKPHLSLIALLLLLCTACDYGFNEINPVYAVPLINSNLGIYNLLAKTDSNRVTTDPDGVVTVVYNNKVLQLPAGRIFTLSDQSYSTSVMYSGPTLNPFPAGQSVQLNGEAEVNFSAAGIPELYRILLEKGGLSVSLNSNVRHTITYILTFPDLVVNGTPVNLSGTSQYNGSGHAISRSQSIDNAAIDLSKVNTTFNTFRVRYNISIISSGSAPISSNDGVTIGVGLNNLSYNQVDCYLGNSIIPLSLDSVEIDLFQFTNESQTPSGASFALTDPRVNLKFTNNMTIPMNINLKQLLLKEPESGISTNLLLSNFQNPFSIQYPLVPGQPVETNVSINRSNSNLRDLITPKKKVLIYQVEAMPNPGSKTINRITKEGMLGVETAVELPLTGFGYDWVLQDTVQLGLSLSEQQNLKSGVLRIN
ncbi:MAG: hypothetical protein V4616_01125, partial [Bacteroidota bacterium]